MTENLSGIEAGFLIVTGLAFGFWVWDLIAAAGDYRRARTSLGREVALQSVVIEAGAVVLELALLWLGIYAATRPEPTGGATAGATVFWVVIMAFQVPAAGVAVWRRTTRRRARRPT